MCVCVCVYVCVCFCALDVKRNESFTKPTVTQSSSGMNDSSDISIANLCEGHLNDAAMPMQVGIMRSNASDKFEFFFSILIFS